jgi:oligopeptide/dipeptide ABC transporter ATP-binding protein
MMSQPAAVDLSSTDYATPALEVRRLSVSIASGRSAARSVLDDVSFKVMPGEAVGLVGESGSGKSMTALAALGLLPATAQVTSGEILLDGTDLLSLNRKELRRKRGGGISMVLQDPVTALDPSFTVGYQLGQSLRLHRDLKGSALQQESINLLKKVRIPGASKRLGQYPHELSGGMRQRVCSAIALASHPQVLIADEPTTALDVTTQAQYLGMLKELQQSTGFALILITHDLAIIRQMCQSVVVMYAGQVVEEARPVSMAVDGPSHPYTKGLFESIPKLDPDADLKPIAGNMPEPGSYPAGCRFAPRCDFARSECSSAVPSLTQRPAAGCRARCFGTEPDGWIDL